MFSCEICKVANIMASGTTIVGEQRVICKLHFRKICGSINPAALSEVFSGRQAVSILGANSADNDANRFSYWAAEPGEIFEFKAGEHNPLTELQAVLDKYKLDEGRPDDLPAGIFCGGWIGYFGYELGRYIEKLPQRAVDDLVMPIIRLCFYDRVICYDRFERCCLLIVLEMADDADSMEEKLTELEDLVKQAEERPLNLSPRGDFDNIDFSRIHCNMSKGYYLKAVEKIKNYIYEGDVYQINFSQRFECDFNGRALDLFAWENLYNPSPYAAYIDAGDFAIVSASPEMFITICEGLIRTRPIKGTRPRISGHSGKAARLNQKNFDELLCSEKEKAELNMIVDLERNDLVRICEYGTRKVIQPRTIEGFPTVFHAVATVQGRLRGDVTFSDVLRAVFPGGSITGAPKIRSMEIIGELEPTERGVYTGSIGFIGIDGNVCLNIAIRTIIIKAGLAFAQTGGGIVADSTARDEWQECLTKARALLAGISAVQSA